MNQIIEEIGKIGIVPVVVLNDAKDAEPLAEALCEGGLPCAEITFRTDAAEESIRKITKKFPKMLVGAGTVLTCEQADRAVAAGAKFIVSPGFEPKLVEHCLHSGIPITPGTNNPSNVSHAVSYGLDVVKFFPAEQSGGLAAINAIGSAFPKLKFMPTGGINAANVVSYLSSPRIHAVGGSWMVKGDLIRESNFDRIRALTKEAVGLVLGFDLAHIGINCRTASQAKKNAEKMNSLFGFETKDGNSSVFSGSAAEFMKKPYLGANGHIAISSNSVERAVRYLKSKGVKFNEDSAKTKNGTLTAIYLKDEISGFAVHLLQK
jgi:2-dehydro-3-deoxyphosphogluconate aldolase/(4S)-4-hydroxy-2-oxoglutarate aldolase